MKKKAVILITLGIVGAIFVCMYDIIAGKPVCDISGPKSISALVICGLFIITGIRFLLRR
ncbi:MAG: hypothetical protein KKD90_06900 [Candidatus Omnitrophica bacterium]|nr:hypothetical protein [Candidatus Omnitrophota bacterium]